MRVEVPGARPGPRAADRRGPEGGARGLRAAVSYPLEIELQNLAAVQECTSRELLPESFRKLEREFVTRRIRELKVLLEER